MMQLPKRVAPTEALKHLKANKLGSAGLMQMEKTFAAKNYAPLPVVFAKAQGVHVWDPEGKRYYDFLSAYSATNQGHNHPRIVAAMKKQLDDCALSSRAYFNDQFPLYAKFVTEVTGYDRLMPANSGAEANEVALKMARKWAYRVKGVEEDQAIIVACAGNFHGRTISIISASDDPDAYEHYGPFTPGFDKIPYDDLEALENIFKEKGDRICAFWVEPIQGEAGVYVPQDGYLRKAQELCKKYNVLLLADEVQTGFGRTGKLFCSDYDDIKPDAIIMGKALSGGLYPVSGVVADEAVMGVFAPGTHGSTFAGSPIAAVCGIEAISVLIEENLVENSYNLGFKFRDTMSAWSKDKSDVVQLVRGRGLLNAIAVDEKLDNGKFAYRWCIKMAEKGVLAKPTHGNIIRFSPPLTITQEQLDECMDIIKAAYAAAIAEI
eukprot:Hpha_TRINITY_DN15358_c4_g4::TRINITY_DN15358_c4_g4_i1::g.87460::m.87460/K00819/rocD, OAT; ornithine--oxo-acid transaminase